MKPPSRPLATARQSVFVPGAAPVTQENPRGALGVPAGGVMDRIGMEFNAVGNTNSTAEARSCCACSGSAPGADQKPAAAGQSGEARPMTLNRAPICSGATSRSRAVAIASV